MDLALIPIGAYAPRWFMKDHHCNVEEAIQIHHDLNSKRSDPDKGKKYYDEIFNSCSNLMMNIVNNAKPIIAVIDGIATAAGCQLVASCDLAYAGRSPALALLPSAASWTCSTQTE